MEAMGSRVTIFELKGIREGMMATGLMWDYQVVEFSGVPEPDEATLNPFGLIGYELVTITPWLQRASWWPLSGAARSRRMTRPSWHERRDASVKSWAAAMVL
jgi:hypothetical protein